MGCSTGIKIYDFAIPDKSKRNLYVLTVIMLLTIHFGHINFAGNSLHNNVFAHTSWNDDSSRHNMAVHVFYENICPEWVF